MVPQGRRVLKDKYEIVSKIKQGGFGIVYYGFDRVFEKPVAIKAIEPNLLEENKYVDLFLEEAKKSAKLSHNNIVHIYDLIRDEANQYYIIMEFIEGYDLGKILSQCKKNNVALPGELTVFIIKEICKALEYAHNKRDMLTNKPLKLVHQDISPSNVMISVSGQVKLIDFGLAKIRMQHEEKSSIALSGKLPYMAPEQLNGGTIDRKTDIFSLGTIFYEMLTNNRLIDSTDPKEAVHRLKKFKLEGSDLNDFEIPDLLENVLLKMLKKNADERYFGANGVYLDLIEYLMSTSHTVELSDELAKYVQDLYGEKKTDEIIAPSLSKIDSSEPELLLPTIVQQGIVKSETTAETEPQKNKTEAAHPVGLNTRDEQIGELERILTAIKSSFSESQKMKVVAKDNVVEPKEKEMPETPKPVKFSRPLKLATPSLIESLYEDEKSDDDLKTVIDVLRLSARKNQKKIKFAAIGLILLILILLVSDIIFKFSFVGQAVFNRFFPPAIKIESIPPGATCYLDNERIPGKTPISIPKIQPGSHLLTLTRDGFGPLVKSIQVPAKGNILVAGEVSAEKYQAYFFRFKSQIELNSEPLGSTVYLNKIQYPQKTPTSIEWEAGIPLSIEMEFDGFDKMSGLTLNTIDGTVKIDDERYWSFEKQNGKLNKYMIEAKFKKIVKISTMPSDVNCFVDEATTPVQRSNEIIFLPLSSGSHDLLFKKQGYNDKLINVSIDEKAPESLYIILDRLVNFAVRKTDSGDTINAVITKYVINNREYVVNKATPCQISLPSVATDVYLYSKGYEEKVIHVPPTDMDIFAQMSVAQLLIEIQVNDALTGLPISNAAVFLLPINAGQKSESKFGITDEDGRCSNPLEAGQYNFKVTKEGYYEKQLALNTMNGNNRLEFKLIIH